MGRDRLMRPHEATGFCERFIAMGTRVELHLFGEAQAAEIGAALRQAIETVDDALTIHRISSTTLLNDRLRTVGEAAVDDPVLWQAILSCDALHRRTHGLFDPTAGMGGVRWHEIEIDRPGARLRSARTTAIDFGGIGKGIALDLCLPILGEASVASALLSLGESSILAHGEHPLGGAWPLTVPDPRADGGELIALSLQGRCVSISSTIGAANGDTVSPADGAPIRLPLTTVAIDPSGATAEAFSTAMLVADQAQRAALRSAGVCETVHHFDLSGGHRPLSGDAAGDTVYA